MHNVLFVGENHSFDGNYGRRTRYSQFTLYRILDKLSNAFKDLDFEAKLKLRQMYSKKTHALRPNVLISHTLGHINKKKIAIASVLTRKTTTTILTFRPSCSK